MFDTTCLCRTFCVGVQGILSTVLSALDVAVVSLVLTNRAPHALCRERQVQYTVINVESEGESTIWLNGGRDMVARRRARHIAHKATLR